MKRVYFRQCKLRKENAFTTSYIPDQFAVLGRVLKLKTGGEWDDGWTVIEVSSFRHLDEDLPDSHDEIKSHRKATGDALPKSGP